MTKVTDIEYTRLYLNYSEVHVHHTLYLNLHLYLKHRNEVINY